MFYGEMFLTKMEFLLWVLASSLPELDAKVLSKRNKQFHYSFETDNGIAAQAQGTPRNLGGNPPVVPVVAQGSFSWTSPEGVPVAITYVADENGYQPQVRYLVGSKTKVKKNRKRRSRREK